MPSCNKVNRISTPNNRSNTQRSLHSRSKYITNGILIKGGAELETKRRKEEDRDVMGDFSLVIGDQAAEGSECSGLNRIVRPSGERTC